MTEAVLDSVRHLIRSSGFAARALIQEPPKAETLGTKLAKASIPVTFDACRACPNPCDVEIDGQDGGGYAMRDSDIDPHFRYAHEEWPSQKFFDVDLTSDMLGSVKPYHRQVVISTGKNDWQKEVTEAKDTLAFHLNEVHASHISKEANDKWPAKEAGTVPGIFEADSTSRLGILNGSHHTTSDDHTKETVLIFPDYKVVTNVDSTVKGAGELWDQMLNPAVGRVGRLGQGNTVRSWTLPYRAVVLLCSHKRRDARCAIAAPVLKRALTCSLESCGWEVHDQVDDPECSGKPMEDVPEGEREAAALQQLKGLTSGEADETKRALVLYNSHTGGHKFAGNIIIYFPNGTGVWYGRVSSHEVGAVTKTITEGRIFPTLLRGGIHLKRPEGKTLIDW
ncbi:hypothetical protein FRB95_004005 [Tulasnella sp. JGI-2019a]|nr:hypothetical protein FRB95_004005 [Tulasnella sp. JGI-2019a]